MDSKKVVVMAFMALVFLAVWNGLAGIVDATNRPILQRFNTISTIALTMPGNGEVTPYPVARVKRSTGNLKEGHLLISNSNKRADKHAGVTIMDVAPDGSSQVFSHLTDERLPGSCPGGLGLITGLVVLQDGWVIAGNLPLPDESGTDSGCLVVVDNLGNPVTTFSGSLINGPREMVAYENGEETQLFVTNVLNETEEAKGEIVNKGTVVRINLTLPRTGVPQMQSITIVGSGFPERTDPTGLVLGPTGLGLSPRCGSNNDEDRCTDYGEGREMVLYVADSLNNRIAVIDYPLNRTTSAGTGQTLSAGGNLKDPLSLIVAPNGHILTVNREDGIITETTAQGQQIAKAPAGQFRHTAWID